MSSQLLAAMPTETESKVPQTGLLRLSEGSLVASKCKAKHISLTTRDVRARGECSMVGESPS